MAARTEPPPQLRRTLGIGGGIVLAIGSVAGSGILFLPSVTYHLAGSDALVVWLAAAALCVPLLLVFGDMVREVPDGSGIEGFVARGLGVDVAASVPVLILATYYPGLAAASLVAGGYLESAVGGGSGVRLAGALGVISITTWTNLVGARAGARAQALVTWTLLGAALLLVAFTFPDARGNYDAVAPELEAVGPLFAGIVVAFWAYAGFENMTFVAGEMRNPRRDYLIATLVALVAYGTLAVLLTANLAAIFPPSQVDELAGVAQLARHVPVPALGVAVITTLALALVQANTASWLWGTSRLVFASARERRPPAWFATLDARGIPRRAVLSLALPGAALTCATAVVPGLVLPFVVSASAIFMFLYLLALASYVRVRRRSARSLGAVALILAIGGVLATRGWYFVYPLAVTAATVAASWLRRRRRAAGLRAGQDLREDPQAELEVVGADHERRREPEHVRARAQADEARVESGVHDLLRGPVEGRTDE
jgi:amino acid efflux transporter